MSSMRTIMRNAVDHLHVHASFFSLRRRELKSGALGEWFEDRSCPLSMTMKLYRFQVRRSVMEWVHEQVYQRNLFHSSSEYKAPDWSDVTINVRPVRDAATLDVVPMRQEHLSYAELGGLWNKSNKHEGHCTLDAILQCVSGRPHFKNLTFDLLCQQMEELNVVTKRGVTVRQMLRWAQSPYAKGRVSMYFVDPFRELITKHVSGNGRYSCVLICNDKHVYGVHDPSLKRRIAQGGCTNIKMGKVARHDTIGVQRGDVLVLDIAGMGTSAVYEAIVSSGKRHVVLHKNGDGGFQLRDVAVECVKQNKFHLERFQFVNREMGAFELPLKRSEAACAMLQAHLPPVLSSLVGSCLPSECPMPVTITKKVDAPKVEEACAGMRKIHPEYPFNFYSSTLTTLSLKHYILELGSIPKSSCNQQVGDAFRAFPPRPLVETYERNVAGQVALDISGCCRALKLYNAMPWCVVTPFDEFKPFTGSKINAGFYVIKKPIGGDLLPRPLCRYVYSSPLVLTMLKLKLVVLSDISFHLSPSYVLPANFFRGPTQKLLDCPHLSSKVKKELSNRFDGCLGKRFKWRSEACMTNDFDTASALLMQNPQHTAHEEIEGIHYLLRSSSEEMDEDRRTICRQILDSGIARALELAHAMKQRGVRITGIKTDAVYGVHPEGASKASELLTDLDIGSNPGQYRFLEPSKEPLVHLTEELEISQTPHKNSVRGFAQSAVLRSLYPRKWNACDPANVELRDCLVTGPPGTGKTYRLVQQVNREVERLEAEGVPMDVIKKRVLVIAYKTAAVDNLRLAGLRVPAQTFDHLVQSPKEGCERERGLRQVLQDVAKHAKYLFHDEFTETPAHHMTALLTLKRLNPDLTIMHFGDRNQCAPIEIGPNSRLNDYFNCRAFRELCNFRLVTLPSRDGSTERCSKQLMDAATHVLKTGMLPHKMQSDKKVAPRHTTYICWTNKRKRALDKLAMQDHVASCDEKEERIVVKYMHRKGLKQLGKQTVTLIRGLRVCARQNFYIPQEDVVKHPDSAEINGEMRIQNNNWLVVNRVQHGTVHLLRPNDGFEFRIAAKDFHRWLELGYAHSVCPIQGRTIEGHVRIYESYHFTRQQMYTALTRVMDTPQLWVEEWTKPLRNTRYPRMPQDGQIVDRYSAALYELQNCNTKQTCRGITEIKGECTHEAALAAIEARVKGHAAGTCAFDKVYAINPSQWKLKLLDWGMYPSKREVMLFEAQLISQIDSKLCVNEKHAPQNVRVPPIRQRKMVSARANRLAKLYENENSLRLWYHPTLTGHKRKSKSAKWGSSGTPSRQDAVHILKQFAQRNNLAISHLTW